MNECKANKENSPKIGFCLIHNLLEKRAGKSP